jgi:uncharacterized membrane protein (Fun14 family)
MNFNSLHHSNNERPHSQPKQKMSAAGAAAAAAVPQQDNKAANQNDNAAVLEQAIDSTGIATNVSLAAIYGACVGVCFKKWTKDAMYGVGGAFVFLQVLSHYGWITINWGTINKKVQAALDQDGDGKLDMKDVKIAGGRALRWLTRGLPDAAGFSAGFVAAVKYL